MAAAGGFVPAHKSLTASASDLVRGGIVVVVVVGGKGCY